MRKLILRSFQSPGDVVMLTAAVRDLHRAYPGAFLTDVRTTAQALWEQNPQLTPLQEGGAGVEVLEMHYPLIHQSNQRPYHFIHGYLQYLEERLGLRIPPTEFRGEIHLSQEEKAWPPPGHELGMPERFWIVVAGGKYDFTAKWWNPESFQRVVDLLQGRVHFVQCGEAGHWHPRLTGVTDLVGRTSTREFLRLVYHAQGVLAPVTFAMHLAAAVETRPDRPTHRAAVIVAGGREPAQWEAYPHHQFLSTNGALPCCAEGGCWKSRCQLVGDGDEKDRQNVCLAPVQVSPELRIPKCMAMIRPEDVVRRIELYYEGGALEDWCGPAAVATAGPPPAPPSKPKARVLLKFRHGLGDAAQFTIVLKHLRKYRPDWEIDLVSLQGKHSAFHGLCRRSYHDREPAPDESSYAHVYSIDWHEAASPSAELPSTKVTRCLREVFKIEPELGLYRYEIASSEPARRRAAEYLRQVSRNRPLRQGRFPVVLLHYQGNTSQGEKDLSHDAARAASEAAIAEGLVPVILDWDHRSPLPDQTTICCPGTGPEDLWGNTGTGDAEMLAALVDQAFLMIGIDSGPLHVAGATSTPTLAVWTGHFPGQYYELAENVTHLVPSHWRGLGLAQQAQAAAFFEQHYRYLEYRDAASALQGAIATACQEGHEESLLRLGAFWVRRDNIEQDLVIVRDIYEQDAYRTAELESREGEEVVVNVGAHIGCFARLWHKKSPRARILCVEACPENLGALKANVGEFAEVIHAACTYESGPVALLNTVQPNCTSTGSSVVVPRREIDPSPLTQGGCQYWQDLRELPKVMLEDLLERFGLERIDVLKLDCEGSEYSILAQTPSLARVRRILGEYHGRGRWEAFRQERLRGWEYRELGQGNHDNGNFQLTNPVWPPKEVSQLPPESRSDKMLDRHDEAPIQSLPALLEPPHLRIAIPGRLSGALWALTKVPSLLRHYGTAKAQVALCGPPPYWATPVVERFDFVESVEELAWDCLDPPGHSPEGTLSWTPSQPGWRGQFDWLFTAANRHLENGWRLEGWLPEFPIDWSIADRYRLTGREVRQARELEDRLGPYGVFSLGSEAANTTCGHNRGPLWKPEDWGRLAELVRSLGLAIVLVGAPGDRSYLDRHARPYLGACLDAIGEWNLNQTFAVIQRARLVAAYPSGIGVLAVYLGIPTAIFWRPEGDSTSPDVRLCARESLSTAWVPGEVLERGRYLPLVYGRTTPESVVEHITQYQWHQNG